MFIASLFFSEYLSIKVLAKISPAALAGIDGFQRGTDEFNPSNDFLNLRRLLHLVCYLRFLRDSRTALGAMLTDHLALFVPRAWLF